MVCGMWYVVCGMWYVICGMWYVVCGMWYVAFHKREDVPSTLKQGGPKTLKGSRIVWPPYRKERMIDRN